MMKSARYALLIALTSVSVLAFYGCSSDDSGTTPGGNNGVSNIYIEMKSNANFKYDNTALDSLNNPTSETWKYEAYTKKGSFILGAYNDWFYRIGTDKRDDSKDTVYVRVNTGSASGASFTKDVQMYGFQYQIYSMFVAMIIGMNPAITPPSIPGQQWDVVAMYQDDAGKQYDLGKEWQIGSANGLDLGFSVTGFPVPLSVNVKITGKLESKGETYTKGSINCKAWKSSVLVTLTSSLFKKPAVVKFSLWLSDNPDGIVKLQQESTVIELQDMLKPYLGSGFTILGEKSESYEYTE
jgi:hypothetical protein